MLWAIWLFFLAPAKALLSSGIIFPLDIYPGVNCNAWSPVIKAIQSSPTLPFIIVINPNTGPGAGSQPDANYQACIPQLLSASSAQKNLLTLGYVATRDISATAVTNDVLTYSQWNATYRPAGIYFDGVILSVDNLSIYKSYAENVRQNFGQDAYVVLDPGAIPATADYFDFADLIVTVAANYSQISDGLATIGPIQKQGAFIHNAPADPTKLVANLVSQGIGALFVTNNSEAEAYINIPGGWSTFVNDLTNAQVNGSWTVSNSSSTGQNTTSPTTGQNTTSFGVKAVPSAVLLGLLSILYTFTL